MEDVYEYQASISGITSIQYDYTGKQFAVATINGDILIIDMKTFATVGAFNIPTEPLSQIAWGNDLSSIFVGDGKGNVTKLDLINKKTDLIYSSSIPVTCIDSCRTQFGIAVGLANGQILIIRKSASMQNNKMISAHDSLISSICYHDCGFIIISSDINGCIRIWDISTLKCKKSIMIDNCLINSLHLSDKQDVILVSTTSNLVNEGCLKLFSLPDLELISQFTGFKSDRVLMQCGFTSKVHNEFYVFSPSNDGCLRIWKLNQKEQTPIESIAQEGVFIAVSANPKMPFLVTGGGPNDGFFRVFKIHMNNFESDESNGE